MIAFTSWDIGQYVYFNCFLTRLYVISFEINFIYQINLFFYITKKSRQKFEFLESEKIFQGEIKKHFSSFLKSFHLPKIVSD